MSSRRKIAGPRSVRDPLLAVLEGEYARAIRAKQVEKAEEIAKIVEAVKRVWSEPLAEMQLMADAPVVAGPVQEWTPPPEPIEPPAEQLPPVGDYRLRDLIESIPEGMWGDDERRTDAKHRLKDAVLRAAHITLGDQMRYELAMQAHNRNVTAMDLFREEAGILRVTVADLAARIIAERKMRERRMMHAYAVLARLEAEIDRSTGQHIEALAEAGIREIQEMQE